MGRGHVFGKESRSPESREPTEGIRKERRGSENLPLEKQSTGLHDGKGAKISVGKGKGESRGVTDAHLLGRWLLEKGKDRHLRVN